MSVAEVLPQTVTTKGPSLETIGMTKVFGSLVALDNVSIKVPAGTFHALLGENGAGKSTLVKCIMGFYIPDRGTLMLDGQQVEEIVRTGKFTAPPPAPQVEPPLGAPAGTPLPETPTKPAPPKLPGVGTPAPAPA